MSAKSSASSGAAAVRDETAMFAGSDPALDAGEPGAGAGVMGATTAAEPADTGYETGRAEAAGGGLAAAWIALGVTAAVALGGIVWYAHRPHETGMAQLTPGVPATESAAKSPPPALAQNTAAPPRPAPATP